MSSLSRVKNIAKNILEKLKPRQKYFLGFFLLFLLYQCVFNFEFGEGWDDDLGTNPYFISIFSIVGIIIAWRGRSKSRKKNNDKSLRSIIFNDYNLYSYASLSILSLVYTIILGAFSGAGLGFINLAIGQFIMSNWTYVNSDPFALLLYSLNCLFVILITRVLIEVVSLLFRVAEDISKYVNK